MSDQQPKTQFFQNCGIFLSGTLVGAVLALGGELAWKQVQLSKNEVEIQLPSANSTAVKPASSAQELTIPPPPPNARSQPLVASPTPLTQPSQTSLTNIPKLPSISPTPSPSPTLATTERVSFETGATGTTVRDSLQANQLKRYTLNCSSNQEMTVKIEEGAVSVDIIAPDGTKLGTAFGTVQWQGKLSNSGDHTIEISSPNQSNYAVKVEVK
ncbi:hypothetical protein [Phormidium nigroviride]